MPPTRAPRRRAQLSRSTVLQAAAARADSAGIDAVSMRNVAQDLGVVPMALYNHVANKEELLSGMVDIIVAEIAPLDPEIGWKDAVRRHVLAARVVMLRHPWAVQVIKSRTHATPTVLDYIDSLIGSFLAGGFTVELTHEVMHALGSRMWGFALDVFPTAPPPDDPAVRAALLEELRSTYPHIAAIAAAGPHAEGSIVGIGCDDQHEFEFGLDVLLDGIEMRRDQIGAPGNRKLRA